MADTHIIDITSEQAFVEDVLEQSKTRPVVVDFWAPWCGPCRALGPTLEALAKEGGGKWVLAKLNVDDLPALSGQFQIQGIPAVKAFSKGQVVDEFVGALPAERIKAWLAGFVAGPEQEAIDKARTHEAAKEYAEAREAYEQALSMRPLYPEAIIGLARVDLAEGNKEEGQKRLQQIAHVDDEALEQELAQLKLQLTRTGGSDLATLEAQVEANPDDLEARLQLGHAFAAAQDYERAFASFLEVIKATREGVGEQAKEAMVQLFAVVGMHSELASRYRSSLSSLLFS